MAAQFVPASAIGLFDFNNSNNIVMSESGSKQQMNRDGVGENETLFDFLKRKKKYNLENTLNKTLFQQSLTKKKIEPPTEDEPLRDERTRATHYQSNNDPKKATRETITPKKIEFDNPKKNKSTLKETSQPQNAPNQGKSFLSMISPLKSRGPPAVDYENDNKENIPRSNKKTVKPTDSYSKQNVTKSINAIKDTVNSLTANIKNLKEKTHGLVIQFNPFFNHIADSNTPLAKQVGEFRNKLKSFEALVDAASSAATSDEIVEGFHKTLEEHLQMEEGHLRKWLEKAKEEEVAALRSDKDRVIERLQAENKKLNKEVDILQRKLERAENHHQNLSEAVTERQMTSVQQMQRIKATYEATIDQLTSKNQQLAQRLNAVTEKNKQLERQLKNERFSKEEFEQKRREEVQNIIEVKDAYLLNEILVLKAEFNADLNRVNELHKIKEAELLSKIDKKGEEINKLAFERGCDKQIESKILEEANQIKAENQQLKAKVDCIITDMYRMNEELYQHWMALKDIKALSNRLGSFSQYRKIYEDLLFNDHLFH